MSDDRPKRDTMSLEEATVSNMWEIAAIVEVLERKGLCTKHDLYEAHQLTSSFSVLQCSPLKGFSYTSRDVNDGPLSQSR